MFAEPQGGRPHAVARGNQPFVDGNKRIAWICGKVFLELHGVSMEASDAEALELFTDGIAEGMTVAALAAWIDRHQSAVVIGDEDFIEPHSV
jgi:prophage maintenance system killer protein